MHRFKRSIAALGVGSLLAIGSVAAVAPSATAAGCSAGTWGGIYGWGDCRGIGGRQWALKVSCTWGASATSARLTGDGHVDVKCPWGSARTASVIFY